LGLIFRSHPRYLIRSEKWKEPDMPRLLIVACLIGALNVAGCTSSHRISGPDDDQSAPASRASILPPWIKSEDWLDDHPVFKVAAFCALCVGVAALVGLALYADHRWGDN
jgi:hypothetical protein